MNYSSRTYFRSIFSGNVFIQFFKTLIGVFKASFSIFVKKEDSNFFKVADLKQNSSLNYSSNQTFSCVGNKINYFK